MLSDWLQKYIGLIPTNEKPKLSPALSKLQVIACNCDWFITLFVSVVNGQSI